MYVEFMKQLFKYWVYSVGKLFGYIPTQFGISYCISRYYLISFSCIIIGFTRGYLEYNHHLTEIKVLLIMLCPFIICFLIVLQIDKYAVQNYDNIVSEIESKNFWKKRIALVFTILFFVFSFCFGFIL